MPKLLFPNGAATSTGAYVVVQVLSDAGEAIRGNLLADYRFRVDPDVIATDWTMVSVCFDEAREVLYAAGENGELIGLSGSGTFEELIRGENGGPEAHGPIRELRIVGGVLHAVGMGRQVYRRMGERHWVHADAGVVEVGAGVTTGFTSVTGSGSGFLVAVGYDGEIWEFDGSWSQIDSPTNLLLNRVIAWGDRYYAAGMAGTVLCREPEGWRTVDAEGLEADVWDVEVFLDSLYLATANGLFQMTADEELRALDRSAFTRQTQCVSLSAGGERLWCFGGEVISSSDDGVTWREEAVF